MAARRVGPTGYVLATDISANMLKVATDAAREADLTNVGASCAVGHSPRFALLRALTWNVSRH
jgi:ubiquinone/menaquinone biosynthesis C-methylase UbiE